MKVCSLILLLSLEVFFSLIMDSCWISSKSFFCLYWRVYGTLDTSCVPLTFSQPELSLIPATAAMASFLWAPMSLLQVQPDSIWPLGPTTCLFPSLLMPQWEPVWEPLGTHQNVFTEKRDLSFSSRDSAEMHFTWQFRQWGGGVESPTQQRAC